MTFQVGTKALAKMRSVWLKQKITVLEPSSAPLPPPHTHLKLLTMADPAIKPQLKCPYFGESTLAYYCVPLASTFILLSHGHFHLMTYSCLPTICSPHCTKNVLCKMRICYITSLFKTLLCLIPSFFFCIPLCPLCFLSSYLF